MTTTTRQSFGKANVKVEVEFELSDNQLEQIARRAAELVPAPEPRTDGWLTPKQLAGHLAMSPRWVAYRVREGMPHVLIAGKPRFKAAEVDQWLEETGHLTRRETLNQSATDASGAASAGNGHRPRHEEAGPHAKQAA
jgi:hypothetical protein